MSLIRTQRRTWAEINLKRIANNISLILDTINSAYSIAVVKANAYGHGAVEVSKTAIECGVDMLAVATLEEALILRENYADHPILVLGVIDIDDLAIVAEKKISVTIHDLDWLKLVDREIQYPINIHLKIDTGMTRLGLHSADQVNTADHILSKNKLLKKEGLYTHYAFGESLPSMRNQQLLFERLTRDIDKSAYSYVHLSNSAALSDNLTEGNTIRLGISMYGLLEPKRLSNSSNIKQALSLYTRVTQVKNVPEGTCVGYDHTFTMKESGYIATIPIGYADGFLRRNQGRHVMIAGRKYPVVGRICMDQCMVLVDSSVCPGDLVEVINDELSVCQMSEEIGTIPYEIVCLISSRVPRIYNSGN